MILCFRSSAQEILDQVAFVDTWNLRGYRRSSEGPSVYVVVAQNGTLIDTYGCSPTMLFRVSIPFAFEYNRPFRFSSDVGEDWNLCVRHLIDGIVILGVRKEITPKNANALFAPTAARFGGSVRDASRTPERTVHESFDFAVIDAEGNLVRALGGIPLRTSPPTLPPRPMLEPTRRVEDKTYTAFLQPITNTSGKPVGLISVFEDVTDDQRLLRRSATFNTVAAALLWIITLALSVGYLRQVWQRKSISCTQIPFLDEGETIEFKSALRWDYIKRQASKDIERAIAKAVIGFLNSAKGGTLVIGMSDTKEILGLDADYASLRSVKPDRDGFEQVLHQVLINAIGESRCISCVKPRFSPYRARRSV